MSKYTLRDAAKSLDMDVLELAREVGLGKIPAQREDGKVYFSEQDISIYQGHIVVDEFEELSPAKGYQWVDPDDPNDFSVQVSASSLEVQETVDSAPHVEPIPSPTEEPECESPEKFTIRMIHELRCGNQRGIHTYHTNFNELFNAQFPDLDPTYELKRMEKEGLVDLLPRYKGVIMFDNSEKTYSTRLSKSQTITTVHDQSSIEGGVSYNYESKNKWRTRWFDFLRENLSINESSNILTLIGPEALELPGYDKLGIERFNIIGVERDKERAEHLRRSGLGIQVIETDMYDFLKETDQKFDAVLLDYDGKISEDKVRTLEILVQRQLLQDQAVLGLNLFGRRESNEAQMLLSEPYFGDDILESLVNAGIKTDPIPKPALETNRNLNGVRDYGITAITLKMLMGKDAVRVNDTLLDMIPREDRLAWNEHIWQNPPERYMDFLRLNEQIRSHLEDIYGKGRESLQCEVRKLAFVAGIAASEPYFINALERFAYNTQKGNNTFFSDFYAVDQKKPIFKVVQKKLVRKFIQGKQQQKNFLHQLGKLPKLQRKTYLRDIRNAYNSVTANYPSFFVSERIPDRVNLTTGNGIEYQCIGTQIRQMLDDGISDKNILNQFPDMKPQSLAGYKSARTKDLQEGNL